MATKNGNQYRQWKRSQVFAHRVAPGIFGNNLKIENILLDDRFNAKVSAYSIPLPSKNILNYQSATNQNASAEKEYIYQLGVILFGVITGRQIASSIEVEELKDERSYAYEIMRPAVQITTNYLSKVSSTRPSIEDVLWNLQ